VVFSVEEFERVVAMFAEELLVAIFVMAVFVDRGATLRTVGSGAVSKIVEVGIENKAREMI